MSVRQLSDGRWICEFRKGRDPERAGILAEESPLERRPRHLICH